MFYLCRVWKLVFQNCGCKLDLREKVRNKYPVLIFSLKHQPVPPLRHLCATSAQHPIPFETQHSCLKPFLTLQPPAVEKRPSLQGRLHRHVVRFTSL